VLEGTVEVTERDGSASTLLTAPARATFGRGRTASAPLSGHQAARLRAESEMNFMPWTGLDAARAASGSLLVASQPPGELHASLVQAPPVDEASAPVEIESMVRRRSTQIRACYERRLKRDPSLAGTVSLKLRVGDAGQVTRVDVEQSTLPDPLVADCLRHEAAGWSFAQGRNATVVYPFVFRTQ